MKLTRNPGNTNSSRVPGGKMGKAAVTKRPSPLPKGKKVPTAPKSK